MKNIYEGKQSFEDLIENYYLYVDKTEYIYDLINDQKSYFLSRHGRFGKSLFLSTLKKFFLGLKDLFKNLSIMSKDKDYNFESYPVISLDMAINCTSQEVLEESIMDSLRDIADDEELALKSNTSNGALKELIRLLKIKVQ